MEEENKYNPFKDKYTLFLAIAMIAMCISIIGFWILFRKLGLL